MRTIDEYMRLPYKAEIIADLDEGGYVASYPELVGCITCGETMESAVANLEDAKRAWLEAAVISAESITIKRVTFAATN
ncbi:MAG: type II toxin-antitoxin system HicB family antitoxin [Clostridia bacterium]|nr:type II toxin-antitoxin system HicB family antitoxin [Clostridia bacterium]